MKTIHFFEWASYTLSISRVSYSKNLFSIENNRIEHGPVMIYILASEVVDY